MDRSDHPVARTGGVDGRRLHYGQFYGLAELAGDDRPLAVVIGNCQAESVRLLLAGCPSESLRTVRVPPVFELDDDDLPHLSRILGKADVLVMQPVRDDYRGLPLGTAQLASLLPRHGRVVRFPAYRYAGLYPWQVVMRSVHGDPPLVPYLDLRTVLSAATGSRPSSHVPPDGVRAVSESSIAILRSREKQHGSVPVSDLILGAGADAAHVINHPGNTVLVALARRVQEAVGVAGDALDPGRTLLSEVFAPLESPVCEALGIDGPPREAWRLRGEKVSPEEVHELHLRWLADRPDLVAATVARHEARIRVMGLA